MIAFDSSGALSGILGLHANGKKNYIPISVQQ